MAGIYAQGEDGKLSLSAGRDITLSGGQVVNGGSQSQTVLSAGRDLSLNAVVTSAGDNLKWDSDNWLQQSVTQHTGSAVTGAGSVLLVAGQDIRAQAATVTAGDGLGVAAGRDISLSAATDSSDFESHHKSTGGNGAFSKTTVTTHDVVNRETAQGTQFSGDSVTMQANNNLLIEGSSVAGDNAVRLTAGNNLTVTTAQEHGGESHQRQEKKTGLSGTGGIGISYGTQQLKVTDTAQGVTQQGSTVGSVKGDVTLEAGKALTVKGSDLVAGSDMLLTGKEVNILAAENSSTQTLSPIFDKEKEQNRLKEAQLIAEIGSQAGDIARTQGQIAATKVAKEKMKDVTPEQLKTAEAEWRKAHPGEVPTSGDISQQAYQTLYDKAFAESGFGTGGKVQRAIQAATAAVQGLAGGDIAKAVAGGAAPYIANIIGSSGLDDAGKVMAHAAVNACEPAGA